jgi:hypothetical protein
MKIVIQKISLLIIGVIATMVVNAQTIKITASVTIPGFGTQSQVIANGQTFDGTLNGALTNINAYLPVTVKVENTGSSALTLTASGGKYIVISGTTASADFAINESTLTGTIAAGGSQNFTVNLGANATNGSDRFVDITIHSNDAVNGTYVGSIKYSFSGITTTSTTKASDIGLSLYPNPSNDGQMHVTTNNVVVDRIVVSNVSGQTEEFTATEFKTSLKGLLLVRLYTDKGVVSEKIIIQE